MSFSSKFKRIEIVISFHASAMNFQRIFDKSCRTRENSHLSDSTRRSSMQTGGGDTAIRKRIAISPITFNISPFSFFLSI